MRDRILLVVYTMNTCIAGVALCYKNKVDFTRAGRCAFLNFELCLTYASLSKSPSTPMAVTAAPAPAP